MALRIRLLRELSIERDGATIAVPLTPKARSLLTILALRHGHLLPVDELIERLWPGRERERATASLRVLVSQIRSGLGEPRRIEASGRAYRLVDEGMSVDLEEFESAADSGRANLRQGIPGDALEQLQRALALYRGDLVEADAYQDWALGVRARLRGRMIAALEDQADALAALGRPRDAVDALERVLEQDRVREGAYQRLMRAHFQAGQQDEALRAYERCRAALDEELGVDPLPETMRLHEQILRRELLGPPVSASVGPREPDRAGRLVGRPAERVFIETVLARGRTEGRTLLITGEPGIGKTLLVEETLRAWSDLRVLAARCYEPERDLPFQPITEALASYLSGSDDVALLRRSLGPALAWLVDAVPELRQRVEAVPDRPECPPAEARARTIEALGRAILALARGRQLVLWIDDVQWADESTLEVLHFVARRPGRGNATIVFGARADELPPGHPAMRLVSDLAREDRADRLELGPLRTEDVASLLARAGADTTLASAMASRTGGNAFFVKELVAELAAGGLPSALPTTVRDSVVARVHRLPPPARESVEVAAVLGGRFDQHHLAALLHLTGAEHAGTLDLLVERRFLRPLEPGRGYEFVHDLVRESIYDTLGAARRSALHQLVAEHLERLLPELGDRASADISFHAERAGDMPRTFRHALLAAEHAERAYAMNEALVHLDRASRASADLSVSGGDRRRCWIARGRVAHVVGRTDDARADLELAVAKARADSDALDEMRALLQLAVLEESRDYREALRLARAAYALAPHVDPGLRVRCLTTLAIIEANAGALDEAARLIDLAELEVATLGPQARLDLLDARGLVRYFNADLRSARATYQEILVLLGADASRASVATYLANLAICDMFGGEIDAGLDRLARADLEYAGADAPSSLAFDMALRAYHLMERGSLDEALGVATRAEAAAERIGHRQWRTMAQIVAGGIGAYRGDAVSAQAAMERAWPSVEAMGSLWWSTWGLEVRGRVRSGRGELDAAVADLREASSSDRPPMLALMARASLAELLFERGQLAAAAAEIAMLVERDTADPTLAQLRGEGLLAVARDDRIGLDRILVRLRAGGAHLRAERLARLASMAPLGAH